MDVPQLAPKAEQAANVLDGSAKDLDAAVGILNPRNGEIEDAIAQFFGQDEQFGIEEPFIVLDVQSSSSPRLAEASCEGRSSSQQGPRRFPRDRFESALRIRESRPREHQLDQAIVNARDDFAPKASLRQLGFKQPRPDCQIVLAAEERRDQCRE